jgi:hypothetical protein
MLCRFIRLHSNVDMAAMAAPGTDGNNGSGKYIYNNMAEAESAEPSAECRIAVSQEIT